MVKSFLEKSFLNTYEPRLKGPAWKFYLRETLQAVGSSILIFLVLIFLGFIEFSTINLAVWLLVFTVIGWIYGWVVRRIYLKKYHELKG